MRGVSPENRVRVGVSMCLLGHNVRYDGGHKRDRFVTGALAKRVEWVPICPEVEVGMGTPREPIRLERRGRRLRLLGVESGIDHTEAMRAYARRRVEELARHHLSGFVLKEGSPSCGPERVRVHRRGGRTTRTGRGLFAEALQERFPNLPIEDEKRLRDRRLREIWLERVFAYRSNAMPRTTKRERSAP